jgi:hypothetical protein
VSGEGSRNRFGWLSDEEDPRVEEALREDAPGEAQPGTQPGARPASGATRVPAAATGPEGGVPAGVPGIGRGAVRGRPRRNRPKNPKALRNDPERMMAGARIKRDVRRRVDQALADPAVVGEGETNYSLLVESLLVRWLGEVCYPLGEGGVPGRRESPDTLDA